MGVLMPPNIPTQPTTDPLDSLLRQYLTTTAGLHTEAYEVVNRWYIYLNTLTDSLSNQIRPAQGKVGLEAVELAFETPVAGFQGNLFWQQYGNSILPLVQRDIVSQHLLTRYAGTKPDMAYTLTVMGSYTFIGLIVSLVQCDGLASWKEFELKFRETLDKNMMAHLNGS